MPLPQRGGGKLFMFREARRFPFYVGQVPHINATIGNSRAKLIQHRIRGGTGLNRTKKQELTGIFLSSEWHRMCNNASNWNPVIHRFTC